MLKLFSKCTRHALWTRIRAKSVKKPGVLEIWLLVCSGARISKEHEKENTITILTFYFSGPFLVRDHFSCKYAPRIKAACLSF